MKRTLILILGAALFGVFAAVVFASQGSDDPAGSTTAEDRETDTVERTTTVEVPRQNRVDISGPVRRGRARERPALRGRPGAGRAARRRPPGRRRHLRPL